MTFQKMQIYNKLEDVFQDSLRYKQIMTKNQTRIDEEHKEPVETDTKFFDKYKLFKSHEATSIIIRIVNEKELLIYTIMIRYVI
jgi:hypothetical protein